MTAREPGIECPILPLSMSFSSKCHHVKIKLKGKEKAKQQEGHITAK